jgi:hypothetical protein
MLEGGIFSFGFAVLVIFPVWRIFQRAGLSPAWSLSLFVPWVGPLVAAGILAFAKWGGEANLRVLDESRYEPMRCR